MGFMKRKKHGIYNDSVAQKEPPQVKTVLRCPDCGAVEDEPCRDALQRKMRRFHKSRMA